jgi:CubicO group peptidase (beta-lactamase class C family)
MLTHTNRRPALTVTFLALAVVVALGAAAPAQAPVFPDRSWALAPGARTAEARRREDALTATLRAGDTTAMLIVVGGRVRYGYGDLATVSYVASVRKSLVAVLYGPAVARGDVRLASTLRELDIDDRGGLLPAEREATVGDLLAARSGVYHRAANLGDASDRAPARGSVAPGAYFLYNNWDFNALEAILERRTGRTIYQLFTDDLAVPLGLEDWDRAPGAYAPYVRNDTGLSDFPAHHLPLSTRDMARIGYLMLRGGRWHERQVVPAEWVQRITTTVTPADEVARTSRFVAGLAYGRLWWILEGPPFRGTPLEGGYTATGAAGQFITVVPRLDAVIAHKTQAPSTLNVPPDVYLTRILPQAIALLEP